MWGNGRTATESGVLGAYPSRAEAEARAEEFLRDHADNPAVGAWVRTDDDTDAHDTPVFGDEEVDPNF